MTKAVQWARAALDDLKSQIAFIVTDDPDAARRVADKIRAAGVALGRTPTGRPGRIVGTYEKSLSGLPYVIAYAVTPQGGREMISILRLIHTSRDWPKGGWPRPNPNKP